LSKGRNEGKKVRKFCISGRISKIEKNSKNEKNGKKSIFFFYDFFYSMC
jgi:hypothetical protein